MVGLCIVFGVLFYLFFINGRNIDSQMKKDKCFNCGRWVDENQIYCSYCDDQIKKICNECGRIIEINWRDCPFCGHNEEQRF